MGFPEKLSQAGRLPVGDFTVYYTGKFGLRLPSSDQFGQNVSHGAPQDHFGPGTVPALFLRHRQEIFHDSAVEERVARLDSEVGAPSLDARQCDGGVPPANQMIVNLLLRPGREAGPIRLGGPGRFFLELLSAGIAEPCRKTAPAERAGYES